MRLALVVIFLSLAVAAIIPTRKAFTILPMERAPRGTFVQSLENWITDTRLEAQSQHAARNYFEGTLEGSSESPTTLRHLNQIISRHQRFSPFLFYLRARVKHQLKDYEGAVKDYNHFETIVPRSASHDSYLFYCAFWKADIFEFEIVDNERAEIEYTKFINSGLRSAVNNYFNRGLARQKLGKHKEAIEDYSSYLKNMPSSVVCTHTLSCRAECYEAIGEKAAARADAMKVIAETTKELQGNKNPHTHLELGKMRILIGDIRNGRADLEMALKLLRTLKKPDGFDKELIAEVEERLEKLNNNPQG